MGILSHTADGYIRVSRRGGREGDRFISPDVQRDGIEGWARLNQVEIVRWWEEIDQSGAKRDRPMFQEALERCERGESGGIVVAKLDRFARSAIDALESIRRLNECGARLVSVEDGFDGTTPMGRFAIGILTLIAELELERITENWEAAKRSAVERGIHISAMAPTGYRRTESGRLEREEPAASLVAEVFRQRALGASHAELGRFLEAKGVVSPRGNSGWPAQSIASMLANPVYLGQARSGSYRNDRAHEPIVTRPEFFAVQAARTVLHPRDGSVASLALLGGLLRCAGCGHTLKITGSTHKKSGQREALYYCSGRFATGECTARASTRAAIVDPYVEEQVLRALRSDGGLVAEARVATETLDRASADVAEAEHELDLYVQNARLITILGEARFVEGVQARQRALDTARDGLDEARKQTDLITDVGDGDLLAAWPGLTAAAKRQLLHGLLDRVVLRRAGARGRAAPPIAARTQIVLRGNVLLEPQ